MNHSINDDDYYVVHPEKKHIVKRLSSSSVRVPYGTKPKDHAAIRPHIEDANKKHGDGHTVMKGMDLKYESGYKPLQEEKEMKDYLTQAPFSFAKEIAEGFAPKQTEAQVVTESTHDDGTKKSTGNAFDFKAMIAKKREEEPKLRNHDKVKTSTGAVYKRKEDAEGADETDVKPQEKRGRGRPPGKYGSYKKRIKEALEQYAIDEGDQTHDIESIRKHFGSQVAFDAASHSPAMMQRKGLDGKSYHLVKVGKGKYKAQKLDEMKEDEFSALIEDFDQLDELSKGTLLAYAKKADKAARNAKQRSDAYSVMGKSQKEKAADSEWYKRTIGVNKAVSRLTKEDLDEMSAEEFDALIEDFEQLDELSKATLGSYIRRSALNARNKEFYAGAEAIRSGIGTGSLTTSKKLADSAKKRQRGIDAATFRLTKEDLDEMSAEEFDALIEDYEQLDELSKATLASYVKKASKEGDKAKKVADKADSKHDEISGKIGMAREKRVMAAQKGKGSGRIQSDAEVRLRGKQDQLRREKYAALSLSKKRSDGVSKANARLTKEDKLNEDAYALSKEAFALEKEAQGQKTKNAYMQAANAHRLAKEAHDNHDKQLSKKGIHRENRMGWEHEVAQRRMYAAASNVK